MQQVSAKHWKSFFKSFIVSRCQELESLLMCLKTVNQKLSGCAMGEASHKHGAFCWLSVDRTSRWTETNAASWPWLQHSWSALSICSACLIIREEKKVFAKFSKIVIALKQYFSSRWAVRAPLDCSKSLCAADRGNWTTWRGPGTKRETFLGMLWESFSSGSYWQWLATWPEKWMSLC